MAALSRCVRVLGRLSLRGSPAAGGGAMIAARGVLGIDGGHRARRGFVLDRERP